ncbi:MAG: PEP-CTERM sorting domain-containing protein [Planctomycetaceae bacterium]|nr:PEP-CTERM sorting domain-containing protein [Planctomycetaceae bacterium]
MQRIIWLAMGAAAVTVFACARTDAATWLDMGLVNGDFSSSSGAYSNIGSNSHYSFGPSSGWNAGGSTYNSGYVAISGGQGVIYHGSGPGGSVDQKLQAGYLYSDPLSETISNATYKLEFDWTITGANYEVQSGFHTGTPGTNATWCGARWNGTNWLTDNRNFPGSGHAVLIWDNSGLYSAANPLPVDIYGAYNIAYYANQTNIGQALWVDFGTSVRTSYSSGSVTIDNVSVTKWGDVPVPELTADPVSETTIDFGQIAVLQEGVSHYVTLSNTGTDGSKIDITQIAMYGEDRGLFYASGSVPVTLTGGATDSVQYEIGFGGSFTPGLKTAQLKFTTSEGDVIYNLRAMVGDVSVPEPASMALVLFGAVGLLMRRRRN